MGRQSSLTLRLRPHAQNCLNELLLLDQKHKGSTTPDTGKESGMMFYLTFEHPHVPTYYTISTGGPWDNSKDVLCCLVERLQDEGQQKGLEIHRTYISPEAANDGVRDLVTEESKHMPGCRVSKEKTNNDGTIAILAEGDRSGVMISSRCNPPPVLVWLELQYHAAEGSSSTLTTLHRVLDSVKRLFR